MDLLTMSDEAIARAIASEVTSGDWTIKTQKLDPFMNDPKNRARTAHIFELVAGLFVDRPTLQADALLGAVYHGRNVLGLWDDETVLRQLNQVADIIAHMEASDEVSALTRRRLYHLALIHREIRKPDHFLTAAAIHEQAADIAPTAEEKIVELTCAACERMFHAVEANDHDLFQKQSDGIRALEEQLAPFAENTGGLAWKLLHADVTWVRALSNWLLGTWDYPERAADLDNLNILPEPHRTAYAHWPIVFSAITALEQHELDVAINAADKVLLAGAYSGSNLAALLVVARANLQMGHNGLYRAGLCGIEHVQVHGGHFVRAVARREFEKLGG